MADQKKLKRLAAAATLQFNGSTNIIQLSELVEGGEFDLHPFATETDGGARVYFPAENAPGYGVAIEGDLKTLGRFARAILSLERKGDAETDAPATV